MDHEDFKILNEIGFSFLHPYKVAGMGEPWLERIERTLELLKDEGIGAILTLTEDNYYGQYYQIAGLVNHHVPIDDCEPPSRDGMDSALAFIDDCCDNGIGVAVHCFEGRGRTGTVLGVWLGKKELLDHDKAIKRIKGLRIRTVLTESQRNFFYQYLDE